MTDDPYHDRKIIHWARLISPQGQVSPWCAASPRALNLRRAKWTLDRSAVTCRKCLAAAP